MEILIITGLVFYISIQICKQFINYLPIFTYNNSKKKVELKKFNFYGDITTRRNVLIRSSLYYNVRKLIEVINKRYQDNNPKNGSTRIINNPDGSSVLEMFQNGSWRQTQKNQSKK